MSIERTKKVTPDEHRKWEQNLEREAERIQVAADSKRKQEGGKTAADEKLDSYFQSAEDRFQKIQRRFNEVRAKDEVSHVTRRINAIELHAVRNNLPELEKKINDAKKWSANDKRTYIRDIEEEPFKRELDGLEDWLAGCENFLNKQQ
jgi:hypothetical protein